MSFSYSQDVWIGLYREPGEDWTWVDGTILNLYDPAHYQDWGGSDPNESDNDAAGARIVFSFGKWGDRLQTKAYWSVCEKGKRVNLMLVTSGL